MAIRYGASAIGLVSEIECVSTVIIDMVDQANIIKRSQ